MNNKFKHQDLILTNLLTGYKNSNFIYSLIYPAMPVPKTVGKYVTYNKEKYIDHSAVARGKGRHSQVNVIDFNINTAPYQLEEWGLGAELSVAEEEGMIPSGLIPNLREEKVDMLNEALELDREKTVADFIQDIGNYDASNVNTLDNINPGKYYWTNNVAGANPLNQIQTGISELREDIGMMPDTIIFGYETARVAAQNDEVKKLAFSLAANTTTITPMRAIEVLAQWAGIPNYAIGYSQYTTSATGVFTDIWSDICWIGNVAKNQNTAKVQSWGRMLYLAYAGMTYPAVFREMMSGTDGIEQVRLRSQETFHLINADAGYLIENCAQV